MKRETQARQRAEQALAAAREQQAATSEILCVIVRTPTDAQAVFEMIELHGGRIWVQSQLGVGSTFTFTIPGR